MLYICNIVPAVSFCSDNSVGIYALASLIYVSDVNRDIIRNAFFLQSVRREAIVIQLQRRHGTFFTRNRKQIFEYHVLRSRENVVMPSQLKEMLGQEQLRLYSDAETEQVSAL